MLKNFYLTECLIGLLCLGVSQSPAHNSYTGNYSGAPGQSSCAASCHATAAGTLTVSGFPSAYVPGQSYTITVKHNGGSKIINFNATTRIGATSTVAGTFTTSINTALYTGTDGGVYAGTHLVDSAKFLWTAPAKGTGAVNFYLAGMQGTSTGSKSGQSTKITLAAAENTTAVRTMAETPHEFALLPNYPNPFNPSTTLRYSLRAAGHVKLAVYSALGQLVSELVDGELPAGLYEVDWNANAASGVYLYRLEVVSSSDPKERFSEVRRMVLMR